MKILFVQPSLPKKIGGKPTAELHHKYFPIGLIKLATLAKQRDHSIQFQIGNIPDDSDFIPDEIWVTTVFTYWEQFYADCIKTLKQHYPQSKIILGGIYATLHPERALHLMADEIVQGVIVEAEGIIPDYSLLPQKVNFAIIHSQRGCISKCPYCMTYKIEPTFTYKNASEILSEIQRTGELNNIRQFSFYDNNPLANPYIDEILKGLADVKIKRRAIKRIEFQSGFDTRFLTQELANLIKQARVINPRIAWDDPKKSKEQNVYKVINMFLKAGYKEKDIMVFMIYNHDQSFTDMEYKRKKCREWGVQISDCRYVPFDLFEDRYRPNGKNADYYIHDNWTNEQVRQFRRNVRGQNMILRHVGNGKIIGKSWTKHSIPIEIIQEFSKNAEIATEFYMKD